jgi:hypothetical protein
MTETVKAFIRHYTSSKPSGRTILAVISGIGICSLDISKIAVICTTRFKTGESEKIIVALAGARSSPPRDELDYFNLGPHPGNNSNEIRSKTLETTNAFFMSLTFHFTFSQIGARQLLNAFLSAAHQSLSCSYKVGKTDQARQPDAIAKQ